MSKNKKNYYISIGLKILTLKSYRKNEMCKKQFHLNLHFKVSSVHQYKLNIELNHPRIFILILLNLCLRR